MVKVSGTDYKYFTFTQFQVEKISKIFEPIRNHQQIEFFEINFCNFESRACINDAFGLFNKVLLNKRSLKKSLRYLLI